MKINLINFTQVCDGAMLALLRHDRSYVTRDGKVYVIPPSPEFKKFLENKIQEEMKKLFAPDSKNFLVRSCLPSENWRLKHVGKRFSNVIIPHRLIPTEKMELSTSYISFFDDFYNKFTGKKLESQKFDYIDILAAAAEIYELPTTIIYESKYLFDANGLIDRSAKMPSFIHSELMDLLSAATMEE